MPKIGLSDKERICIAALKVLGTGALDMCYRLINPTSEAREDVFHRQAVRWYKLPNVEAFKRDLQAVRPQLACDEVQMETDDDSPITRAFLIRELRVALRSTTDPSDRASIAMKLADLSGLKGKSDEKIEDEKRRYFLPWVSHCRTCQLMKIYRELCKNGDITNK